MYIYYHLEIQGIIFLVFVCQIIRWTKRGICCFGYRPFTIEFGDNKINCLPFSLKYQLACVSEWCKDRKHFSSTLWSTDLVNIFYLTALMKSTFYKKINEDCMHLTINYSFFKTWKVYLIYLRPNLKFTKRHTNTSTGFFSCFFHIPSNHASLHIITLLRSSIFMWCY